MLSSSAFYGYQRPDQPDQTRPDQVRNGQDRTDEDTVFIGFALVYYVSFIVVIAIVIVIDDLQY